MSGNNDKKPKRLKAEYKRANIIKVYFKSVGRFYPVSQEKLMQMQAEGKLTKSQEAAMFEDVPETGEAEAKTSTEKAKEAAAKKAAAKKQAEKKDTEAK